MAGPRAIVCADVRPGRPARAVRQNVPRQSVAEPVDQLASQLVPKASLEASAGADVLAIPVPVKRCEDIQASRSRPRRGIPLVSAGRTFADSMQFARLAVGLCWSALESLK